MTELDIWLVDAFTEEPLRGNAAGVILDAEGLSDEDCHRISAEVGASESAFVFPGKEEGADFHVRFFTPTQEVDLCGHATVAAFWAMATEGRIPLEEGPNRLVMQTAIGNLPVWVDTRGGKPERVRMGQRVPRFETPEINADKLAAILGVGRKQVLEDQPVEIVSTGLRSLHIPLAGLSGFGELRPLRRSLIDLSTNLDVGTIQVFCLEAEGEGVQAHCRVFAPALGIEEDPVTGTAAGALGTYIVRHGLLPEGKDGITHIKVEQGLEMGRPGIVEVEVERDD
jgi:PhzF family phenazine biosynthesis protein